MGVPWSTPIYGKPHIFRDVQQVWRAYHLGTHTRELALGKSATNIPKSPGLSKLGQRKSQFILRSNSHSIEDFPLLPIDLFDYQRSWKDCSIGLATHTCKHIIPTFCLLGHLSPWFHLPICRSNSDLIDEIMGSPSLLGRLVWMPQKCTHILNDKIFAFFSNSPGIVAGISQV